MGVIAPSSNTANGVSSWGGRAVFWAAVVAQAVVLILFFTTDIGYLWFNIIGCGVVVLGSLAGKAKVVKLKG